MEDARVKSIEYCLSNIASFSRSYHTFDAIKDYVKLLDNPNDNLHSFKHICNALLSDAAINWCKVFGTDNEETHWKNIVKNYDDFREKLFLEINISKEDYSIYWKNFTGFRNKVIAHIDIRIAHQL